MSRQQARISSFHFSIAVCSGLTLCSQGLHRTRRYLIDTFDMPHRQGKIDERFRTIYDKLSDIRNQLERLTLTQAWSLRETDLYNYQRQLDRVDESRVNGNFEDATGYKADLHAQRVGYMSSFGTRLPLTSCLDIVVSPEKKLCVHLQPHDILGAGL